MEKITYYALFILTVVTLLTATHMILYRKTDSKKKEHNPRKEKKLKKTLLWLLATLFVLNVFDVISTSEFLKRGEEEGNILFDYLFQTIGFIPSIILKLLLSVIIIVLIYHIINKFLKQNHLQVAQNSIIMLLVMNMIYLTIVILNLL